jgi:hypothetical protein
MEGTNREMLAREFCCSFLWILSYVGSRFPCHDLLSRWIKHCWKATFKRKRSNSSLLHKDSQNLKRKGNYRWGLHHGNVSIPLVLRSDNQEIRNTYIHVLVWSVKSFKRTTVRYGLRRPLSNRTSPWAVWRKRFGGKLPTHRTLAPPWID